MERFDKKPLFLESYALSYHAWLPYYARLAYAGVWLYHLNMFTAVYRKCGKWWAAYVEEVPGVNTQGATLAEARANLKEALALILETNRVN